MSETEPQQKRKPGFRVPAVIWVLLIGAGLTWWSIDTLEIDADKLERLSQALEYLERFYPPSPGLKRSHWWELAETFAIAWLGTLLGLLAAMPMGLLASQNLFPAWLTAPVRTALSLVRSIPSIIWALIFIVVVGFGPLAGVFALACYTAGYLGKMFYEVFEGIPADAIEAHRAMGSSTVTQIRHVVLPTTANALISQTIYMLEYNFRHSTVLGIVGAGGIGRMMLFHIETGEYDSFFAVLLLVLAVVVMLDELSSRIRRRFQDERFATRSTASILSKMLARIRGQA